MLSVSVYDEPDLSMESVPVRPDGRISLPLIGDVQAAGRDAHELVTDISTRLDEYVVEPQVSVIALEFNSFQYSIDGEVVDPGVYPLDTDVSIRPSSPTRLWKMET